MILRVGEGKNYTMNHDRVVQQADHIQEDISIIKKAHVIHHFILFGKIHRLIVNDVIWCR